MPPFETTRFPFRGRVDYNAIGNPQFYIVALKHYDTFRISSTRTVSDIYLTFILSHYKNPTNPSHPLAELYSAYDPTSPNKTVIPVNSIERNVYKPLKFSAKPNSSGNGYILTTSDITSTGDWYLSPNKSVEDAVYLNVSNNSTVDKNSLALQFTTVTESNLSVDETYLYSGIPYKIRNLQGNTFLPKFQYTKEATSETKNSVLAGGRTTPDSLYIGYTTDSFGDNDSSFVYFLIPSVHHFIYKGKTTCYTPESVYYDADNFPPPNPPVIQNPNGLDAAYLYVKYGIILQGQLNDKTYYDFNCSIGWISTNNEWISNHISGTLPSTVDGKACGFSTLSECQQNYWYDYCTGDSHCSNCMGKCADSSKVCLDDTSAVPPSGIPFICGTKPTPPTPPTPPVPPTPTPTNNVWIIVGIIVLVIIIIVIIIYIIYRNNRPPKKKVYMSEDDDDEYL